MEAISAGTYTAAGVSPLLQSRNSCLRITSARFKIASTAATTGRSTASIGQQPPTVPMSIVDSSELEQTTTLNMKDFMKWSKDMIASGSEGGPPRWFSPLDCAAPLKDSPLLLYLPGIDGVGLGLIKHHKRLGKIFNIWCLHVPVTDRTSFSDLVYLVEATVRSEHHHAPRRPIYLLGESFGGCLALAVAARNPHIDLALILANPATRLRESQLENLITLCEVIPEQLHPSMVKLLSVTTARLAVAIPGSGHSLQQAVAELFRGDVAFSSYLSVLADVLPVETLIWRLKILKSAASFVSSRLHAVRSQTLVLSSGKDHLISSPEESEKLHKMLPNCEIRKFNNSGHALLLEADFNLVTVIMGANFYRRGRHLDFVRDFVPPSTSEFDSVYQPYRWMEVAFNPVMISTLENGNIVRGLTGIPSEGPVLLVGYHMMLGLELVPLVSRLWNEHQIVLRGIAHPLMFKKRREGKMPVLSMYDDYRFMGAVPVSATNFYKLLSSKSHVLLYPGGMREALHRKGEEYKLFWPEQSEFVRMAARFGAKIIPFGTVGEDDIGQMLLDYDDMMKVPYLKALIEELTGEVEKLRYDTEGEVSNQDVHLPIILPKVPGRFYFYFGKPIETAGRKEELKSKEKAHELYLEVKSEVERCIDYLKEKRESDSYRNIMARLPYQASHGFDSEVPTFDL
ncbi:phytyl ester synthase 2, chloroplastic isoform X2 [Solanum lycopersicum]|uniref:phytyl ester synthase 2, chloroplastic isoform X2 n=1 Tax=Solanum lycopersicum TaxID=4081 RepID=UPI000532B9FB|nr:acyltransferase-like protein At3g26840, chloroplastic isoform X2 [Solanum lycopersicum]